MDEKFQFMDNRDSTLMATIFGGQPAPAQEAPQQAPVAPAATEPPVTTEAPVTTPQQTPPPSTLTPNDFASLDDILFGPRGTTAPATVAPATAAPAQAAPAQSASPVTPTTTEKPAETVPVTSVTGEPATKTAFYKAMAKELINSGIWSEVNGLEEAEEIDDATFANLAVRQDQYRLSHQWETVKKSNDVIDGIISFIEKGGDADKIIDVFKAQRSVQQLDTTTTEGQKTAIRQYYKDVHKWDDNRIQKYMATLDIDGAEALKGEADFVKTKWDENFKQQQDALVAQQEQETERLEGIRRQKMTSTVDALRAQKIPDNKIKDLITKMYVDTHQTRSGTALTELDYRIMQIQEDPAQFLDFAQFVLDPVAYKKSLTTQGKNTATANAFEQLVIGTPAAKISSAASGGATGAVTKEQLAQDLRKTLNLR